MMKKFLLFLLFVMVCVSAPILYSYFYINQMVFNEKEQVINIPKGASLYSVANLLEKKSIIDKPRLFVKIGQFYGHQNSIKYGEFIISPNDSFKGIYEKIIKGDTVKYPITFVEGEHMYHYARLIEKKNMGSAEKFLKLVKDKNLIQSLLGESLESLEGYLFPDTYHFSKTDDEMTIVKAMVKRFLKETEGLNFNSHNMKRHQIITLASIVEKETGADFERKRISSVYHNRVKKKMRLQADPTIIYGILNETGNEIKNIRTKDIRGKTAYNTYVIKGLPPGPIANPGFEAINAAVKPEISNYLYFVSRNDGTHVFTENYKMHLRAVKKFQLNSKMRKGKSWRDLKKSK